jgi:hypothetical protein
MMEEINASRISAMLTADSELHIWLYGAHLITCNLD